MLAAREAFMNSLKECRKIVTFLTSVLGLTNVGVAGYSHSMLRVGNVPESGCAGSIGR